MSKKRSINIEKEILSQIKTGKINMKPKWYFVTGSILSIAGLVGLSMGVVYLINLSVFFLKRNGPINSWRIQVMIASFPWWIPVLAFIGIIVGAWLLKKYDFSYRKNFALIVITFVISVLFAGLLIDRLGLNEYLSKGRMRGFYQRYEQRDGSGRGSIRGVKQNYRQLNME